MNNTTSSCRTYQKASKHHDRAHYQRTTSNRGFFPVHPDRCNYRVGDVYHEVLPSTGCEDLYRMYMELQQRITVLEKDYYNRLAQQRRAREEMMNRRRRPAPVPGVRKENLDNRAGTR